MKKNIFDQYVTQVMYHYEISREDLFSKDSSRRVSSPRHVLYYLCYNRKMELFEIVRYLATEGYVTKHQPVKYGINKMKKKIADDPDYIELFKKIDKWAVIKE